MRAYHSAVREMPSSNVTWGLYPKGKGRRAREIDKERDREGDRERERGQRRGRRERERDREGDRKGDIEGGQGKGRGYNGCILEKIRYKRRT